VAHGITTKDGMAYTDRVPWHGLGVKVEGRAMTAAQAIEAAGMNWTVGTTEIYINSAGITGKNYGSFYKPIEGKVATIREDTDDVLGIVSQRYTPVQNTECFKFFDEIVGAGDAVYHTAGTLWGGRKVWILAHMGNGEYQLDNGDQLESYILLDNSHDGGSALRMRMTPIRVVCSNTLASATRGDAVFAARHTSGIAGRVTEARDLLGLNRAFMERFMGECNEVATKAFHAGQMNTLTYKLLDLDNDKSLAEQRGIKSVHGEKMFSLFWDGRGNKGETRWDAVNAVTEFLDYERGSRSMESVGGTDELAVSRRLDNSWFGDGATMRTKAWNILQLPDEKLKEVLQPVG
jgi:phage/plasmid-like protein (TIGR03299 family)